MRHSTSGVIERGGKPFHFFVEYFDECGDSCLNGGKISKLILQDDNCTKYANYDKDWVIDGGMVLQPTTEEADEAFEALVNCFN